MEDYYFLGKIIKPHGFDGKVNTYLDTDDPAFYAEIDVIYINFNNSPVPYFVEFIKIKNNKATLKLQDVDNLEAAEALTKREMYLPLSSLPPLTGKKFYFHEVKGFVVTDTSYGELGPIAEILEYPNQAVFRILRGDKEVLIPVNDEVIQSVDRDKKRIVVTAPEGLLEVYLG
jgi:16S rRNA processing protein RimM